MKTILIETDNYKTIESICEDALVNNKMIGIIGSPGLGKSTSIHEFKKRMPKNVYILSLKSSMTTKLFCLSIFNSYGDEILKSSKPLYFIFKEVICLFDKTSENKLLIIDEAEKIKSNMIEFLNEFRDATKHNTGIVLAGIEYLKKNLQKWKDSDTIGVSKFINRISSWQELSKPTIHEIKAIISAYKITDEDFINANLNVKDFARLTYNIWDYLTIKN